MTRLRTRVIPAVVVVVVAAVAMVVFRREPAASWLRVEAPSAIVIDQPFVATVTLLEPADGAFLDFDLHGRDKHKNPLRCVVGSQSQAVTGGQPAYRFSLVLHDRPDVAHVHAVIFLSRSGQWSDAFRVAGSEPIQLIRGTPGPADIVVRPLAVHDQREDPVIEVANPPVLRAAITLLWLGAAGIAATAARRSASRTPARLFIVACGVLALWEALATGPWLAEQARALALSAGVYEERRTVQQVATVVFIAVCGLLASLGLRRSRQQFPALALAGIALYAVASLAGMLSLHEIDRILAGAIGPWPLAGVLRLTGACAGVAGALDRLRKSQAGF